ncbi:chemotaxis protein CheW [Muricoccus radiodurans]|uniref:chemotaxis protein CheW n=1 Tax=Muricoccus radiodurans TaxID=2231721 RepID=UPI003CF96819
MTAGIVAGGRAYRLPPGSGPVAAPVVRPLPRAPGLQVALLGGSAVPAHVLPGTARPPAAWVRLPGPEGTFLLGADALLDAVAPDAPAPPWPDPPTPRLRLGLGEGALADPATVPPAPPAALRLEAEAGPVTLPLSAVDRLLPMPVLHPAPGAPTGTAGLAWTESGPVLVLAPASLPLLAVLTIGGRHLGLPCRAAVPAPPGTGTIPDRLLAPVLLTAAPAASRPSPSADIPTHPILVARAGETRFALAVEEVVAVLPPQDPRNRGRGALAGIAAHRGDVLPVLDAGERLGTTPVLRDLTAPPMLRLGGAHPLALAVSAVPGLRHVPEPDLVPVPGDGPVAAVARLEGDPLPVFRARAFAAALAGHAP